MTSVRFSVRFGQKPWFSVRFRFYQINRGFRFGFSTVCCLMCMHSAECCPVYCFITVLGKGTESVNNNPLIQCLLTVTEKNSEVASSDPIMLEDELWMRQRKKPSQNRVYRFFENRTAETEFSVFEFWGRFGSVFRKPISEIFIGFHTPLFKAKAKDLQKKQGQSQGLGTKAKAKKYSKANSNDIQKSLPQRHICTMYVMYHSQWNPSGLQLLAWRVCQKLMFNLFSFVPELS